MRIPLSRDDANKRIKIHGHTVFIHSAFVRYVYGGHSESKGFDLVIKSEAAGYELASERECG